MIKINELEEVCEYYSPIRIQYFGIVLVDMIDLYFNYKVFTVKRPEFIVFPGSK